MWLPSDPGGGGGEDSASRLRGTAQVAGSGGGGGTWQQNGEVHYLYDGWRVIQERDGNNTPLVSYTRGSDLSGTFQRAGGIGGLLARSDGYSGGNWSGHTFYHADGNGNVTALVDGSGTLQASYRYDSYGNLISSSGALASANVYRFSSKEWLATSSLYYYGYRFYSPNWQRWVNRDPIGERGGVNLYGLVGNSPINLADFWGLQGPYSDPCDPLGPGHFRPQLPPTEPLGEGPYDHDADDDWDHTKIGDPATHLHIIGHAVVDAVSWLAQAITAPAAQPPLLAPPGRGCSTCPVNAPPVIVFPQPPQYPPLPSFPGSR
jgi:RHS repeat-associated protein